MSLFSLLLPDVDPPSTVENASAVPDGEAALPEDSGGEAEERIRDLAKYDEDLAEGLERGAERLAEAFAAEA